MSFDKTVPTGQDVASFLDQGTDTTLVALATRHVQLVTDLVRGYTRNRGFDDELGFVAPEIAAVITTATARLVTNPAQNVREQVGDYSVVSTPFLGFTLAEQQALNRWRKRAS
ncbi:hypothetical protein GCM10009785_33690 [Brooklawnia cerclae]|uniref:Phage gp6-like head-tail connector protein n=1 Tax=Brooklawnia cerclae TaxID=349934 RepID=A0ABX0SGB9_9ACTN|nr:hypothetical protein [Brooklawnia cerclae]NIH55717.1 hypothetical protein [Brooklawnia cerclae]